MTDAKTQRLIDQRDTCPVYGRPALIRRGGIECNVRVEVRDADGQLERVEHGHNEITSAGITWALQRLADGGTRARGSIFENVDLQVNANNAWAGTTIDQTKSAKGTNVMTVTAVYTASANNTRIGRVRYRIGAQENAFDFATYTFEEGAVLSNGGTLTVIWLFSVRYLGANSYGNDGGGEVNVVRESTTSDATTRQLWSDATDIPVVEADITDILWGVGAYSPTKFSHGQVRFYKIDRARYTDDEFDEIEDSGPYNIVQTGSLIAGTFAINVATRTLEFTFTWDGGSTATDTGPLKKRWGFMTLGQSAALANSVRWYAFTHLEGSEYPTAATTYRLGIRLSA